MKCVEDVKLNTSTCTKSCNGLMITGYTKFDFDDYPQGNIEKTMRAYKEYKKWFKFPIGLKGYNLQSL